MDDRELLARVDESTKSAHKRIDRLESNIEDIRELTFGVKASNFLKSWDTAKPNGNSVCVHAFVDDIGIYQTLPWNYQGWHAGGNANNSYIGFEICEPKDYSDKEYFLKVKSEAVKLCVYLCQKFNLAPESILTHCEGYKLKGKTFASNHADIYH